jgi:zinc protease
MKLVALPDSSPLISFRAVFHAGAAHDSHPGQAWMTAAMHASAGPRALAYPEVLDAFFPMAASVSGMADKEMTSFSAEIHRDNLEKFYPLFRDLLLDPGWREEDFTRLRDDAVNHLAVGLRGQNDEELAKEALAQEIYSGHPYGRHTAGSVSALESLTIGQLQAFRQAHYGRNRLWIGLGGGFPDWLAKRVEADFGALPEVEAAPAIAPAPPVEANSLLYIEKPARSVAISLGYPIEAKRGHADYPALLVAASCLGQHRMSSGRLFTRMRQLRGLNYGDYAYIETFPGGMDSLENAPNLARTREIFEIWIRPVETAQAHFALRLALHELDRFVRDGLIEEEFQRTRRFLSKYVHLLLKTKSVELGYAIDSLWHGIPPYPAYLRESLARLTCEAVNAAIRRHLRADRLRIAMAGLERAGLVESIVANAPSPIEYNSPKPADLLAEDEAVARRPLGLAAARARVVPAEAMFA